MIDAMCAIASSHPLLATLEAAALLGCILGVMKAAADPTIWHRR